jgi:SAM-dependent methyltransferase
MAIETCFPGALQHLDGQDLDLLLSLGYRRSYSAGDTLLARGERLEQVTIVEDGALAVEAAGGETRLLEPGELFGAAALATRGTTDESARAATDLTALVFSLTDLEALARNHPEAAARLCLGLAAQLAATAADRPQPVAEVDTGGQRARAGSEPPAPGNAIDERVGEAHAAARRLQRALAAHLPPATSDEARWAWDHLDAVRREIDGFVATIGRAAVAAGAEADRVLQAARDELRPLLARGRLAELMGARAPEEPARYRSLVHVYRNHPEGEAADGLLLDAYLLDRPFCRALRERRAAMSDRLDEKIRRRAHPDRVLRILSLGCGPARSLADVLEQPGMAQLLSVTAVDDDQEAIVYANNLLKSRAPNGDITFHQSPPTDLSRSEIGHQGYDIIASLFVADYLETSGLAATIGQAFERLNPGGVVLMAGFSSAGRDPWAAELFLNWHPIHHAADDLRRALAGFPFEENVSVAATPSGLNFIVAAARAN